MSANKIVWLRLAAILWTLSAAAILVVDATSHGGKPIVTLIAWLAGVVVYYAIAIRHRV